MTLRELLELNKDTFVNGRLKVTFIDRWTEKDWFLVCGISDHFAVGFLNDGSGVSFNLDYGKWALFEEQKPKKKIKLYPGLFEYRDAPRTYVVYYSDNKVGPTPPGLIWRGVHPNLDPIEVLEDEIR